MTSTSPEVPPPVRAPRTDSTPLPMGRTRVSRADRVAHAAVGVLATAIAVMGAAYAAAGAP